jgi:hypothetical protein
MRSPQVWARRTGRDEEERRRTVTVSIPDEFEVG